MDEWEPIIKKYDPLQCGSIDGTDEFPHDKAIARAMTTKYKANVHVVGDPLCTVFVGRLNPKTKEETLKEFFSEYGSIKRLRLVRDLISGISKRYAFIEYKSGSSAKHAASRGNKSIIDDREVLVDMEVERELPGWIPRRFGGGFGGKKESGQLRFGGKDRPFRKPIVFSSRGTDHTSRESRSHDFQSRSTNYGNKTDSRYYSRRHDDIPNQRLEATNEQNEQKKFYSSRRRRSHSSSRKKYRSRSKSPEPSRSRGRKRSRDRRKSRSRSQSRHKSKRKFKKDY